jgi:hypothetical protein
MRLITPRPRSTVSHTNSSPSTPAAPTSQGITHPQRPIAPNPELTDPTEAESADEGAATDADTAMDGGGDGEAAWLAPGALRGMVEDYLRDHAGEEVGLAVVANTWAGNRSVR